MGLLKLLLNVVQLHHKVFNDIGYIYFPYEAIKDYVCKTN